MRLERDGAIWEDARASGEGAYQVRGEIIDPSPKINRIVAHVRGGMEENDPDRREKEADRVKRARLVPRNCGAEGHPDQGGDEAVGLRGLEPASQRGHPIPRPFGRVEAPSPR